MSAGKGKTDDCDFTPGRAAFHLQVGNSLGEVISGTSAVLPSGLLTTFPEDQRAGVENREGTTREFPLLVWVTLPVTTTGKWGSLVDGVVPMMSQTRWLCTPFPPHLCIL